MKTLGNIIWVIFGGLHIALEYFIAGLILMITIIEMKKKAHPKVSCRLQAFSS